MASPAIEESLNEAEAAVNAGRGLSGTGFWKAVAAVKLDPALVESYADRIARIDARAHRDWAFLIIPLWLGTTIAVTASAGGIALIWWSYYLADLAAVAAFLIGMGALMGATHGLAHLAVGWVVGMRFTCWFVGQITQPQPGVKVDYATYLRTPPARRAWMHASGAIMTKTIPLLLIGAAVAADLPVWVPWSLAVLGVVMVVTDVMWSTRKADWKKFRREMAFAQDS